MPTCRPDADRFDGARRPVGHLAMGVGIHACVGQNLARAEAAAVLGAIVDKVGGIALTGAPEWRPNHAIHALDRLPLAFHER
jgi:cytochrome P450